MDSKQPSMQQMVDSLRELIVLGEQPMTNHQRMNHQTNINQLVLEMLIKLSRAEAQLLEDIRNLDERNVSRGPQFGDKWAH